MKIKSLIILLILTASIYANGGNQKYVDGYLVQVASLPISPFAGEKMSAIISFANTSGDLLTNIEGSIRVNQDSATIFQRSFTAPTGTTKFEYTFKEAGLYDMVIEFKFANETRVYAPDHFLVEVKQLLPLHTAVIAIVMFLFGLIAGFIFGRRTKK